MLPPAFFDQSSAHLLFSQVIRKDNVADETSNGISLDDKSLDLSECIFWKILFFLVNWLLRYIFPVALAPRCLVPRAKVLCSARRL